MDLHAILQVICRGALDSGTGEMQLGSHTGSIIFSLKKQLLNCYGESKMTSSAAAFLESGFVQYPQMRKDQNPHFTCELASEVQMKSSTLGIFDLVKV